MIGPADMAKKESTSFISYPYINEVRKALKKAAFETNSCYWDTYLNMGGEGSIQDWVKLKPPLAARDYIHFTNKGAREVADMFIADLMECYTFTRRINKNEDFSKYIFWLVDLFFFSRSALSTRSFAI